MKIIQNKKDEAGFGLFIEIFILIKLKYKIKKLPDIFSWIWY